MLSAMRWGVARGVFSNEAGLGSAPIAAAAAKTEMCIRDRVRPIAEKYDVDVISLIAPTSEQRIGQIAREASSFIYTVSSLGVTGCLLYTSRCV